MLTKCLIVSSIVAVAAFGHFSQSHAGPAPKTKEFTLVNDIRWRNGLDQAIEEAKRTQEPILFLSMFGRIDEKLPCANARTLRATLFKTAAFKKLVSEDVIPAWEMVREVPHVTIDLGDAKKIERTIRGNAVMYLCTPEGKVVDAFPGVYVEEDFMPKIKTSISQLVNSSTADVLKYHEQIASRYSSFRAVRATVGKAFVEAPTLNLLNINNPPAGPYKPLSSDQRLRRFELAARRVEDSSLTPASPLRAIRSYDLNPNSATLAQDILRLDSSTNMNSVRPVVSSWFATLDHLPTPLEAREAILETILKVPYKDPYWGLKDVLLPGTPE